MTVNTSQLLDRVVQQPNRSTCDIRLLNYIWEAFNKWCQEQFDEKLSVRVLGLGDFSLRKDVISGMEFINPMFIVHESFARRYQLHDRRPKTYKADADPIGLDLSRIAQMATDLIGELVGREAVENALLDVVEKIGEVCMDVECGVILLDFMFGRFKCENRSIEFQFGNSRPPDSAASRPQTSSSMTSSVGRRGGGGSRQGGSSRQGGRTDLGLEGSSMARGSTPLPNAPLQRPYVRHLKPAVKPTMGQVLDSHQSQLQNKRNTLDTLREEATAHHLDTLTRLHDEVVLDANLHGARRDVHVQLAQQQQQQREQKEERDAEQRQVIGINHWPFRTEEEVRTMVDSANARQKGDLDKQLLQKAEKRALLESQLHKQQHAEEQLGARQVQQAQEDTVLRARAMASSQKSVEKVMDAAFNRYESYLDKRKMSEDASRSFQLEQRYLSEQAELIKNEEQGRRLAEMKAYLQTQVTEKHSKQSAVREAKLAEQPHLEVVPTVPVGTEAEPEEEAYIKAALRRTLGEQVAQKDRTLRQTKLDDLEDQQHVLNCVALEMQQARYRETARRKDRADLLKTSWDKQKGLKQAEANLER